MLLRSKRVKKKHEKEKVVDLAIKESYGFIKIYVTSLNIRCPFFHIFTLLTFPCL